MFLSSYDNGKQGFMSFLIPRIQGLQWVINVCKFIQNNNVYTFLLTLAFAQGFSLIVQSAYTDQSWGIQTY